MKNKLLKIGSFIAVVIVLLTMTLIPTFAATYNPIVPIQFNNYGTYLTAVAFPGAHALELYTNGATVRDYLDNTDYNNSEGTRIKYGDLLNNGLSTPYIQVYMATNYASIYFNGSLYNGSTTNTETGFAEALIGVTSITSYPVANSFNADTTYHYTFNIVLGNFVDYDVAYQDGYNAGFNVGYEEGAVVGTESGFLQGLEKGREQSESGNFGLNLIGATLAAPMNALNQFVLFSYNGVNGRTEITLGAVVGGAIALVLFIAFLKIFAGG